MIRAERNMKVLLPLRATVEVGNNSLEGTPDVNLNHSLLGLAIEDFPVFTENFRISAGYRKENTPLMIEEWDLRWRNTNADPTKPLQNWIAYTDRSLTQVMVNWQLIKAQNGTFTTGIYTGLNKLVDKPTAVGGLTADEELVIAGLKAGFIIKNIRFESVLDWRRTINTGIPALAKQSLELKFAGPLAGGSVSGKVNLRSGVGDEQNQVDDSTAELLVDLPIYEAAGFQLKADYINYVDKTNAVNSFSAVQLNTGVVIRF